MTKTALHKDYIAVLKKIVNGDIDMFDGYDAIEAVTNDLNKKNLDLFNEKFCEIQKEKERRNRVINQYSCRAQIFCGILCDPENELYQHIVAYLNDAADK